MNPSSQALAATGAALPMWAVAVLAMFACLVCVLYWRQRRLGQRLSSSLESMTVRLGRAEDSGLAGVLNRVSFDIALDEAIGQCEAGERELSVLFVNLDNLQAINDGFGHACGDHAIGRCAAAMTATGGVVGLARTSGGAFVVMVDAELSGACALAANLLVELGSGGSDEPALGCSIGIASYPMHGPRARIVANASTAMCQVRQAGGGHFAVFSPVMAVDYRDQAELLGELRHAIARNQFHLVYQPKIDARSLQITAAEALLRWHHPQLGLISPAIFVPLAERFGFIGAIGNWVIDEACRQAGLWRASGLEMRVAINISAYQMRQDDLVDRLETALADNGLSASRFTCEITESVAMEDTQVTKRTFERMRQAGLHVSIDDFGVGQASLSYLRRLPAAELKIDASFVQDLATSAEVRAIVDAVIKLAHALRLRVVAEGVETQRQRDWLVQMGCDELQGYLFARPMTAKALSLWAADEARDGAMDFRASLFSGGLQL